MPARCASRSDRLDLGFVNFFNGLIEQFGAEPDGPDGDGDQLLLELAQNSQVPRAIRRQAIFWLAESDNDSSVAALTELLTR